MISLVDGDIVCYRAAASCKEGDTLEVALYRSDQIMHDILQQTDSDSYKVFLSGEHNFRKEINPEYKANRKDMVRPQFLQDCREYLVTEWKAKLSYGIEADDMLGIEQTDNTVICSIDKDLKMIPGKHYNFVKQEWDSVSLEDANKQFWRQMLVGDSTDNIFGIKGIGPVKANKRLSSCIDDQECLEAVLSLYGDEYQRFVMNANCLWIKRSEDSTWLDINLTLTNELQHEQDMMLKSMKSFIQSI